MKMQFVLWNPGPATVRVGDLDLPPETYSRKLLDQDEADFLLPELRTKGVHLYIVTPVDMVGRRPRRRRSREEGPNTPVEASPRQRELFHKLTGANFPPDTTRIRASELIDSALRKKWEAEENQAPSEQPSSTPPSEHVIEVLANRLYLAHAPRFPESVEGTTVIINFSGTPVQAFDKIHILNCPAEDCIDEKVLAGIVRLCAAAIRGLKQRVLIYGSTDSCDVVAACVLREHLAIPAEQAVRILRHVRPTALTKIPLLETLNGYKPT